MKSFLKYTLATMVGIVSLFVFFILFMVIIAGSSGDEYILQPNSVLSLKLNKKIVEDAEKNPLADFGIDDFNDGYPLGLNDILSSIESAAEDHNIKAILIESGSVGGGISTVKEIRDALEDFKRESGKKIIAYANGYTQTGYYLASVADKILLHPEGDMDIRGLGANVMFFKDFFKKVGIEPQVIRHGKFKSAVEPFMLNKMSEANYLQTKKYIDAIWNSMVTDISESRGLNSGDMDAIASEFAIRKAQDAVDRKLVDAVIYQDQLKEEINVMIDGSYKQIVALDDYARVQGMGTFSKDKIAVIYCEGAIIPGKSKDGSMGSKTIGEAIAKARKNKRVKAIVLRVNSPGGSSLASDIIWREVDLATVEKPVIVSMGDYAASGGYYIAAAADKIYAQPNTLTGSIGVFGVLFSMEELLKDKLELNVDGYKTHPFADIGNATRTLTADERNIIQGSVERVYDTFITHVSEGRNMSKEDVDAIGQGRVWAGSDALEIGLVDELGGIDEAIAEAAAQAGLENYSIREYPEKDDFGFSNLLGGMMMQNSLESKLESISPSLSKWIGLKDMKGVQARIPFVLEIY